VTEVIVKFFSLVPLFLCALAISAGAAVSTDQPPSAFLPPVGQTVHYRYSDTATTPTAPKKKNRTKSEAATLTITTVSVKDVQVTIAVEGKGSHSLDFHLDETGALQPTSSMPESFVLPSSSRGSDDRNEQSAAEQALRLRLSLASRIGAHSGAETSFPVLLNVPWASGPVNPILSIQSTGPNAFVADASAMTSINPPQKKQSKHLIPYLFGLGILGNAVGGTPGRIAGISATVVLAAVAYVRGRHSGRPQSVDVTLHITGQLANGRLQMLSGDQQEIAHEKKKTRTYFSDKWSLVAE
jgi:hypothetical protein